MKFHILIILLTLLLSGCGGSTDETDLSPIKNESEQTNNDSTDSTDSVQEEPNNQPPSITLSNTEGHVNTVLEYNAQVEDTDGHIVNYLWKQETGTSADFSFEDNLLTVTLPMVEESEDLIFSLSVTDNEGVTTTETMTITVKLLAENLSPKIFLNDLTGVEKSAIQLIAQALDQDGEIVSYHWQQISGTAVEIDTSAQSQTITLPSIHENEELTFLLTVTDDDGATSQSEVIVVVETIAGELSLLGKVQVAGADTGHFIVEAHVGDAVFNTKTGTDGSYSLEINADENNKDELIFIYARAEHLNSIIKLGSVTQTYTELFSQIDEAHSIDSSIVKSLKVTEKSTAALTLIRNETELLPLTFDKYEQAYQQLDLAQLFDLTILNNFLVSTALQPESDSKTEILDRLPEGFSNTLDGFDSFELVENLIGHYRYVSLGKPWSEAEENYLTSGNEDKNIETHLPLLFTHSTNRITLNPDGTGIYQNWGASDINWTKNGERIDLTFNDHGTTYQDPRTKVIHGPVINAQLSVLMKNNTSVYLHIERTHVDILYGGNSVGQPLRIAFKSGDFLLSPQSIIQMDTPYLITFLDRNRPEINTYHRSGTDGLELKYVTFTTNSDSQKSGSMQITLDTLDDRQNPVKTELSGNWSIADNILTLNYGEQTIDIEIKGVDKTDGRYDLSVVANATDQPTEIYRSGGMLTKQIAEDSINLEFITSRTFNYPQDEDDPHFYQWFEFNEDGSMAYIFARDYDQNGVIDETDEELFGVRLVTGIWSMEENQLTFIRHTKNGRSSPSTCISDSLSPDLSDDCVALASNKWKFYSSIIEDTVFFEDEFLFYEDRWLHSEGHFDAEPLSVFVPGRTLKTFEVKSERPVILPENIIEIMQSR